jgi:ABC-type cobalamin transport system permease subunit
VTTVKTVKAEPAVIGVATAAAVNLVVLLLLKHELSADEKAAVVTLVTLIAGLFVRSQVTPVP